MYRLQDSDARSSVAVWRFAIIPSRSYLQT